MLCTVTIKRSDEWIKKQRLETGENVPKTIDVQVNTVELGQAAREILLTAGNGEYPSKFDGSFNQRYNLIGVYCGFGRDYPQIDTHAPDSTQISVAICEAADRVKAEKQRRDQERQRRDQEEAEKQQRYEEAKTLLASDLAERDRLRQQRSTLSKFLSSIPHDALRGTLRQLASSSAEIERLKAEIEDASTVYIFE